MKAAYDVNSKIPHTAFDDLGYENEPSYLHAFGCFAMPHRQLHDTSCSRHAWLISPLRQYTLPKFEVEDEMDIALTDNYILAIRGWLYFAITAHDIGIRRYNSFPSATIYVASLTSMSLPPASLSTCSFDTMLRRLGHRQLPLSQWFANIDGI